MKSNEYIALIQKINDDYGGQRNLTSLQSR
jgi:hypothetical protein